MNSLKYILIPLFLLAQLSFIYSQQGVSPQEGFQRRVMLDKAAVLPSTPEASSLGQFGEFNLDPYVGTISLQVPIHTIAGKTISVPINLLYSGAAPKVNSREGWVGLNWNMTANYAITRSVVAKPDTQDNYYSKKDSITDQTYPNEIIENQHLYRVARGYVETQPDHYYLSYPGGSVKFYITPNKKIIQKEHKNLKITPTFDQNVGVDGRITKFVVRDDKGISYEYAATEEAQLILDDVAQQGDVNPARSTYFYNSAWHLTKITGTNGIETFTFAYESATQAYDLDINPFNFQSTTYPPQNIGSPNCCGTTSNSTFGLTSTTSISNRKFLTSITYQLNNAILEKVTFESQYLSILDNTNCLAEGATDKQLNRIRCFKGDQGTVNILNYDLAYDYCATQRLLLKSVEEKSADGQTCKEPYLFDYNEQLLPKSYVSNSVDHFGYFNGATNTASLIPKITPESGSLLNSSGANRHPVLSKAKAGILTRVTYPTKGYTEYDWEMNRVKGKGGYLPYDPTQGANDDRDGGGLRVASITHYDENNQFASKRSYRYVKDNPTANASSSGILLSEPTYYQISKYTTYPEGTTGGSGNCGVIVSCNRPVISATSSNSLGAIRGSYVGYSRVEEVIVGSDGSNAGKTVYNYKNEAFSAANNLKDNVENGLLENKEVYNSAGDTLVHNTYNYVEDAIKREVFTGYLVTPKGNYLGGAPSGQVPNNEQNNKHYLCQENAGASAFSWRLPNETGNCVAFDIFQSKFERKFTLHEQRWIYQDEMSEVRYFYADNGGPAKKVQTTTNYVYGDTMTNQPTEVTILNSDGKVYKTVTHFVGSYDPSDYPVAGDTSAVTRALELKCMTSFPLVQAQYINNQLVYKTKLHYKQFGALTLPSKLYESFPNKTDALAEVFDNYDAAGNLIQGHRHYEHSSGESQPITMIYSNGKSRMSAQVKNANQGEVAYTGFETNEQEQGGWTLSNPTTDIIFGATSLVGNGHFRTNDFSGKNITRLVEAGEYILSYYTTDIDGITVSGSGISTLSTKTSSDHPMLSMYKRKSR